jgi:hypothetical protein
LDADKKSVPEKVAVVYVTDQHINGATALFPRNFTHDDGAITTPSRTQFAIYDAWADFTEKVKALAPFYRIVTVFGGDVADYDIYDRSLQIISRNPADIQKMVLDTIAPLVSVSQQVYFIRGTEAHSGKSAFLEELIANDCENAVHDEQTASWWYLRRYFAGVKFDITHHANMGGKPWTERNAANALAAEVMFQYGARGESPPKLAFRGHVHRWSDSFDNYYTRAITSGCWAFQNAYSHRIAKGNTLPEIGGLIALCENGNAEVVKHQYPFKFAPAQEG